MAQRISQIVKEIKEDNIKHLNKSLTFSIKERNKLNSLEEEVKSNYDDKDLDINELFDNNQQPLFSKDAKLSSSRKKFEKMLNMEKNFGELFDEINKKGEANKASLKNKLDIVVQDKRELAKKEVFWDKFWGTVSGVLPVVDLIVQHYTKKGALKTIAKIFGDDLIELDEAKKNLKKEEKEDIKKVQYETSDKPSDITKTSARVGTVGTNIINKFFPTFATKVVEFAANYGVKIGDIVGKGFSWTLAGIGIVIGVGIGHFAMSHDVGALIDFYEKRFYYRVFIHFSFEPVEEYFLNTNFEE